MKEMKKPKQPDGMREPASRAVQFAAFDALKGYAELLAEVERASEEKEERRERKEEDDEEWP